MGVFAHALYMEVGVTLRSLPMALICVDPGYTTGLSLLTVDAQWNKPKLMDSVSIEYAASGYGAKDLYQQFSNWYEMCRGESMTTDIVLEKFTKRPGVVDPELTALKVMGVLDLWWAMHGVRIQSKFHERIPVQGKMMATNDVLRRVGVHIPGHDNRHINDATRHGISWLIDQGHVGTCQSAFPRESR